MKKKSNNLIRIGQMAKQAGVSAPTIKHYVKEGLLPKPVKTSKNMAYYDESCIDRIKMIKKMQKEKFLPLDVIKRIIDSGEAYDENLEMGQAILKSHKAVPQDKPIKEAQIEKHTGYPLEKIHILEDEGLIVPEDKGEGKVYDDTDCRIIDLMKRREEVGVRFDYSVETVRLYRDAIKDAVAKDISLFARNQIGNISTQKAVSLMTQADDMLDSFMVLYRFKMLRLLGKEVIKETNELPSSLKILNIFPLESKELPNSPPGDSLQKCFYYLCTGDYKKAQKSLTSKIRKHTDYDLVNMKILVDILSEDFEEARKQVEEFMPKPSAYALNNAIAALTYLFSINDRDGFSVPMLNAKKMLPYLKRIEKSKERHAFSGDFARYICGSIYIMLPDAINQVSEGVSILADLNWSSTRKKIEITSFPDWLARIIDYEIMPAFEIRINRFLAEGYRKLGQADKAMEYLENILAVSSPDSEMAEWAGMQRLLLTK